MKSAKMPISVISVQQAIGTNSDNARHAMWRLVLIATQNQASAKSAEIAIIW